MNLLEAEERKQREADEARRQAEDIAEGRNVVGDAGQAAHHGEAADVLGRLAEPRLRFGLHPVSLEDP